MNKIELPAVCRHSFCVFFLALFAFTQHALAQSTSKQLAGFSKAQTLVLFNATGSAPNGISEARIKTVLELKLRRNGLKVLSMDEDAKDPDYNPYVMLEVNTLKTRNKAGNPIGYAYSARLSVRIYSQVPINTSRAPIEMWSNDTIGVSGTEQAGSTVERVVSELSESLLNAWLEANPKR